MMRKKNFLTSGLMVALFMLFISIGSSPVQAKSSSKYFTSGDLYYHVFKSGQVEVCGTKKVKGTLTIPSKVTFKGVRYTVTKIADCERAYKDNSRENTDGVSVDVDLPGVYYYVKTNLPNGVDSIPGTSIRKLILPSTLTSIGEGAFCGCDSLRTVIFAPKYKKLTIGANAFCGRKLKSITFPSGTIELKENAAGTTAKIRIPASVKKILAGVVNAKTKSVTISKKNKNYKMKKGILYTKSEKKLVGISAKASKNIKVSSKTKSLEKCAFAASKIKTVKLNSRIKKIPEGAFIDCGKLEHVSGTKAVTMIDYAAFKGCKKLTSLGALTKLTSIAKAVFWQDEKLMIALSSEIKVDNNTFSGADIATALNVTIPEKDSVYSVENGLLIRKQGNTKTVILQTENMKVLNVPEGVTELAVAIGGNECKEITLPTTLRCQNAMLRVNGGIVNYRSMTVPKFGRWFGIVNTQKEKATIYVPKGTLAAYRGAMDDAVDKREGAGLFPNENLTIAEG